MNKVLLDAAHRFDGLSFRERLLVLVAVSAVIGLSWNQLVLEPQFAERMELKNRLETLITNVDMHNDSVQSLLLNNTVRENSVNRNKINILQVGIERLDRQLDQLLDHLVPAKKMAQALEDVLLADSNLELMMVKSLPVEPISQLEHMDTTRRSEEYDGHLYKHGIEIEFMGDYFATLDYLKRLEGLPWALFWDELVFDIEKHPQARVRLSVYTLSTHEDWLGV